MGASRLCELTWARYAWGVKSAFYVKSVQHLCMPPKTKGRERTHERSGKERVYKTLLAQASREGILGGAVQEFFADRRFRGHVRDKNPAESRWIGRVEDVGGLVGRWCGQERFEKSKVLGGIIRDRGHLCRLHDGICITKNRIGLRMEMPRVTDHRRSGL
jgi:hypothetical protein